MKPLRTLLTIAATAALALSVMAGPAAAKTPKAPKAPYTYYATIDCGAGPVEVGSWDDLWAPLVDLESGRKYKPVAWHVAVGEFAIDEVKRERKHAVECSYSDGVATGTVTVKNA